MSMFSTPSVTTPTPPSSVRPQLLRCREVLQIVGFSRAYLYSLVADERFPKPIKIDNNCSRWLAEDVDAWIAQVSRQRGLAAPRGAAIGGAK